jgi:hypothetical protein
MTRRTRKARFPATSESEEIVLDEDDWKRIEQAYGHALPLDLREHIRFVTNALSIVANAERSAPALEKVKANTMKLRDDAQLLLKQAGHSVRELAGYTSLEDLTESVAITMKEFSNEDLQFLLLVQSMSAACNLTLRRWETDKGFREGSIWDAWVQSITELMRHYNLPDATRKDSRKPKPSEPNSGFVLLIEALQQYLPKELRRHATDDALPQAIYRARKTDWWPELLPPNIREKFAAELESPAERAERYEKFTQKLRADSDWIERRPGSFVRADIARLMEKAREGERPPIKPESHCADNDTQ